MDTYRWQHNNAVVSRLYYAGRTVQTTYAFATLFTIVDGLFVYRNYFAAAARTRIPKV